MENHTEAYGREALKGPDMRVRNVHQRHIAVPAAQVGALLDTLAGPDDRLWPREQWPAQRFDRPLGIGAAGGHGPIRYTIEEYEPSTRIVFRFTGRGPRGFTGRHGYDIVPVDGGCLLRHSVEGTARALALLSWPIAYRPLHDALMEDSLDKAERETGVGPERPARWSPWVRLLRAATRR